MRHALAAFLLLFLIVAGCRDAAEFFSLTGTPESSDGWSQDYEATPADTWEAFRQVVQRNGKIETENPDQMELRGVNQPPDAPGLDGISIRGRVYDKSKDGVVRSRLIVHARYAKNADGAERQDTAKDYTNAVWRVLRSWKGGEEEPDKGRLDTGSEDPVQDDEAVAYFKVKPADAFEACEVIAKLYGEIEQGDSAKGFIRAVKKNALEKSQDDVRMNVYDRSEGERVRVKVSVRVRGSDTKPRQEIAKGYVAEIRKELEKKFDASE